jgi:hypothetical protein
MLLIFSLLSLLWKKQNKRKVVRSPCCLCVFVYLSFCLFLYPPEFLLGGLWDHLAICLCIPFWFLGFWGSWDHLAVSVSPLIFLRRLMISPCCLYVYPSVCVSPPDFWGFWGSWDHLAVCVFPLIFLRRLMRSSCFLCIPSWFLRLLRLMRSPCCLCIPPNFS